jgi:hypothetical protein
LFVAKSLAKTKEAKTLTGLTFQKNRGYKLFKKGIDLLSTGYCISDCFLLKNKAYSTNLFTYINLHSLFVRVFSKMNFPRNKIR